MNEQNGNEEIRLINSVNKFATNTWQSQSNRNKTLVNGLSRVTSRSRRP